MDKCKGHAKCIRDGSGSLGTTCVRGDYNGLLVVGDIELDVFAQEVTPVQVVDGDIKKTLVLRVWRFVRDSCLCLQ